MMLTQRSLGLWFTVLDGALDAVVRQVSAFSKHVDRVLERRRQLNALARLEDDLLNDIGLTREDVRRELQHSYWRN